MAWVNLLPFGGLVMAWTIRSISPQGFRRLMGQLAYVYLLPLPFFAVAYLLAGENEVLRFIFSLGATGLTLFFVWRRFGAELKAFFRGPVADDAGPEGRVTVGPELSG
jgi:hypothetical protein